MTERMDPELRALYEQLARMSTETGHATHTDALALVERIDARKAALADGEERP